MDAKDRAQVASVLTNFNTFGDNIFNRTLNTYLHSTPLSKGSSHINYKNKNANIEYYTDEKGNIRRRKIKK